MIQNNFEQRKQTTLSKIDKSSKGHWDKRIRGLCGKINSLPNYYTTSSCSGRVVLMINQDKKQEGLFLKIYHELISFKELKNDLDEIERAMKKRNQSIKFKMEPCILHIACKNLKDAQKLYNKAKLAGWKKSGLIASTNRIILELNSTERLEFPIVSSGRLLVSDEFLKIIVRETNKKLKSSWDKVERLKRLI